MKCDRNLDHNICSVSRIHRSQLDEVEDAGQCERIVRVRADEVGYVQVLHLQQRGRLRGHHEVLHRLTAGGVVACCSLCCDIGEWIGAVDGHRVQTSHSDFV